MSEQTALILIRLLLMSSLIRIYAVCHSVYIFWKHLCIVKSNCFILRTTTLKCLSIGTLETINFSFVLNGKLMVLVVPIVKHIIMRL